MSIDIPSAHIVPRIRENPTRLHLDIGHGDAFDEVSDTCRAGGIVIVNYPWVRTIAWSATAKRIEDIAYDKPGQQACGQPSRAFLRATIHWRTGASFLELHDPRKLTTYLRHRSCFIEAVPRVLVSRIVITVARSSAVSLSAPRWRRSVATSAVSVSGWRWSSDWAANVYKSLYPKVKAQEANPYFRPTLVRRGAELWVVRIAGRAELRRGWSLFQIASFVGIMSVLKGDLEHVRTYQTATRPAAEFAPPNRAAELSQVGSSSAALA
jgi:hypothetical protein